MATPADQRLLELLDKWLESLELHRRYAGLDADSYWKMQPWPDHQRPSRWIIDLALQKAKSLRKQVEERIAAGDGTFSDALELMTFLANLIGSEHIERFIPLADPDAGREGEAHAAAPARPDAAPEESDGGTGTRQMPSLLETRAGSGSTTVTREMPKLDAKRPGGKPAPDSPTATREMPQPLQTKRRTPAPVGTDQVARTERKIGVGAASGTSPSQPAKIATPGGVDARRELVINDAARLVQWGRKWYELAELIARMADRPTVAEVRRILTDNKTAIEKKAGGG